jgi:hypothetical protein
LSVESDIGLFIRALHNPKSKLRYFKLGAHGKRPGREADHSSPSGAEVKKVGAVPPFSICLHGIVLKHRDEFTFTFTFTFYGN